MPMPVRFPESEASPSDPLFLIRSRIREKRMYEARFLCRQLGSEIGANERSKVEEEISRLLAQVEQLRRQAREYAVEGKQHLVKKMYNDISQIAIDVPGLAEERQALEGPEAFFAHLATPKTEQKTAAPLPAASETDAAQQPAASCDVESQRIRRMRPSLRLWAGLGCLVMLLVLAVLWTFLHTSLQEEAPSAAVEQASLSPVQTIVIRPISASTSLEDVTPSEGSKEADEDLSTLDQAPAAPHALRVGELQIESKPSVQ